MKGFLILPVLFLFSCTSTKLISSWRAPSAGSRNYQKILVVATIQKEDSSFRKEMEEHLVNDLKAAGYNSAAYSTQFRTGELKGLRYDSIRNKLLRLGFDGVVTISLLAKENERVYVQEKPAANSDNLPLGGFWSTPVTTTGKGGHYVYSSHYFWETSFYDLASIDLLYNARSTAFEVTSKKSLAHRYGKLIVSDMQNNYLLNARK